MIKLLKAKSLTVNHTFLAEKVQLNLSERQSTATVTVGPEAPTISVGDWLQDTEDPGKGIVWRVKSVDTDYSTDTRTIGCEHVIAYLKDLIMFGEVKPGDMSGNAKDKTCTAKQAVDYIIGKQSVWKLGSFGYTKSAEYNFNGDTLFDALETVSSSLLDAWWSYDFSSYPFKLSIKPQSTSVACEMRTDRNIKSLKKTIDRTRMYTRFYPIGKNNLKLSGTKYVEKNTSAYGVISKVETDASKDTVTKLEAWANEKLNNHAEPLVTVTVSGLELSAATGESLDRLTLGTVCRVPLPEFSTTITERITKLNWSDKIADPESVTVTLANSQEDVASIINSMSKSAGGGGRAGAQNDEEDHAWMVDTTDHIGLIAEAVAGEGADEDWSRVASIMVDGQGIHQRVVEAEGDLVSCWSAIEMTQSMIQMQVASAKSDLYSQIEITASSITTSVASAKSSLWTSIMQTSTNIYTQVANAKSGLYSSIEVTASSITTSVASAKSSLWSSIMQTSTNVYVQVANAKSGLYSSIVVTASSIRSEVASAKSGIYENISTIEQTASSIKTSLASAKTSLWSSIMQTSTNIYTQVANAKSGLYSSLEVTASSIRTSLASAKSSLWSTIVQTSTNISLKVSKDGVIAAINVSSEAVKIAASKITLDGHTVAASLDACDIGCGDITCGVVTAQQLKTQNNVTAGTLKVDGELCDWLSYTARKVTLSNSYYFVDYLGTQHLGRIVEGYTDTTLHYLGYE